MSDFLNYQILKIGDFILSPGNLGVALLILLSTRFLLWVLRRFFLKQFFIRRKVDIGRQFAITQFIKYIVYIIAAFLIMQSVGIKPNALLAGGAALLVGIGLGIQQTFNDLISGIILLLDATIEVGDIVKVDEQIGKVKRIAIRTTHVETRDGVIQIIPNSKLVNGIVLNWSHTDQPTRFQINVGVAYGSNLELVTNLLVMAAKSHHKVLKDPPPAVMFLDFANSSLNFQLHFYSEEFLRIEFVKSDIRYEINRLFKDADVQIPFPQQDLWIRNSPDFFKK